MKKLSTLLLLTGSALSLHAQAPSSKAILQRLQKHIAAYGPAYAPTPALKTTAGMERLSAESDYDQDNTGTVVFSDSARFVYSGNRHSSYDYNNFQYVSLTDLDAGISPDFLYVPVTPNNADSSFLPRVAFDTLHRYTQTASGIYRSNIATGSFNLDTSFATVGNRTYSRTGTLINDVRQVVKYDAAGRMTAVYALIYTIPTSSLDTTAIRNISYDAAGRVVLDSLSDRSTGSFGPSQKSYYTYDAAGRYTRRIDLYYAGSGMFDTSSRTTNTYYANGKLFTSYGESNSGGGLEPSYKDSLIYTAGVPGFTSMYEDLYDALGSVQLRVRMLTNRINALSRKDSVTFNIDFGAGSQDLISLKVDYNAAGNPVRATQYDLQGALPVPTAYRNYYYQNYPAATSVKPVLLATGRISVSPNPTTGAMTLRYSAPKNALPVTVRMTNMTGQIVRAESLVLQGTQQQLILGSDVAPGQYLITVQDAGGNMLCNDQILKQ